MNSGLTKPFTKQQLADALALQKVSNGSGSGHREKADARIAPSADDGAADETVRAPAANAREPDALHQQLGGDTLSVLLKEAATAPRQNAGLLSQSFVGGDATQIREAAQAIRGVGGPMNAHTVSQLASEIEQSGSDIDAVRRLLPAFETASREAIDGWRNLQK